jgi:hypothetical protein
VSRPPRVHGLCRSLLRARQSQQNRGIGSHATRSGVLL